MCLRAVLLATFLCLQVALVGCGKTGDPDKRDIGGNSGKLRWFDSADNSGLDFTHVSGAGGDMLLPEIVGAGAALFDYDGDGDIDAYLVQSGSIPGGNGGTVQTSANRLFRNQLAESGTLSFVDVTKGAGVGHQGYAMGAAVGDYDNDGDADLYVTNLGANVLYRNDGNGRFTDVTATSGVDDTSWSTSATFVDYDRDGYLDLFVVNYVGNSVTENRPCVNSAGRRDYCSPTVFDATEDRLFRNTGDGRFADVTEQAGISAAKGAGLGVVAADLDGDGWQDIFVANDMSANHLWRNLQDGRFEEIGFVSGSAYNVHGMAEAGMGVTARDYDGDGDEDLFLTHLDGQSNTLYNNRGTGNFVDTTDRSGLGAVSLPYTGWGTRWFDFDNDTLLDLFVANGAVFMTEPAAGQSYPYEQRNQLFHNEGEGRFVEVRDGADSPLEHEAVSRGAAFGDIDNDGDIDILVTNNGGQPQLLINKHGSDNSWLTIVLQGTTSNRDGYGSRILLQLPGGKNFWHRGAADGSFLSSNDPRVHFGLGDYRGSVNVFVRWPSGRQEVFPDVASRQTIRLVEGEGESSPREIAPAPCIVSRMIRRCQVKVLAALLSLLSLSGCEPQVPLGELPELPRINLEGYLPAVAQQIQRAQDAVSDKPGSAEANGRLGMLYRVYRDYEVAEIAFRRARMLALWEVDWIYYHGETLEQLGDIDGALEAMRAVLESDPDDPAARLRIANLLISRGNIDEAAIVLETLLKDAPRNVGALLAKATVLEQRGELQAAAQNLLRSLEIAGHYGEGHYAAARVFRQLGDEQASRRHSLLFSKYQSLSYRPDDKRLERLYALNRSDKSLVRAAQFAKSRGNDARALELLEAAIKQNPENMETRAALVAGYAATGNFSGAERHYQAGAAFEPENIEFRLTGAQLRISQGRLDEAVEVLASVTKQSPNNARARAWLGYVMELLGRPADAGRELQQAFASDPGDLTTRRFYSRWLLQYASTDDATAGLESMVALELEDSHRIHGQLARHRAANGDRAGAIDAYDQGIMLADFLGDNAVAFELRKERNRLVTGP